MQTACWQSWTRSSGADSRPSTQGQPASTEGCSFDEYDPYLTLGGNALEPLYAVSIPGVQPSNWSNCS